MSDLEITLPAFEVLNPKTGHRYMIYADGRIEGFGAATVVINRIPAQTTQPETNPALEDARKRGLVTPFLPGTTIDANSLVVDKNGVAWWIRPDSMAMIPAGPLRGNLQVIPEESISHG